MAAGPGLVVIEFDRPDRTNRRSKGKSDPIDAEAAARTLFAGGGRGTPKARTRPWRAVENLTQAVPTNPAPTSSQKPAGGGPGHRRRARHRHLLADRRQVGVGGARTTAMLVKTVAAGSGPGRGSSAACEASGRVVTPRQRAHAWGEARVLMRTTICRYPSGGTSRATRWVGAPG